MQHVAGNPARLLGDLQAASRRRDRRPRSACSVLTGRPRPAIIASCGAELLKPARSLPNGFDGHAEPLELIAGFAGAPDHDFRSRGSPTALEAQRARVSVEGGVHVAPVNISQ